ncbi:hypothetical protein VNO78_07631 [Psophocarpus tetragonolobus]|uniref:Uncharacterized protein n=1 Tax=Psophocarpus tetragonolobus TaxID=3891 RepID=A0AAN9T3I6_PSOTE
MSKVVQESNQESNLESTSISNSNAISSNPIEATVELPKKPRNHRRKSNLFSFGLEGIGTGQIGVGLSLLWELDREVQQVNNNNESKGRLLAKKTNIVWWGMNIICWVLLQSLFHLNLVKANLISTGSDSERQCTCVYDGSGATLCEWNITTSSSVSTKPINHKQWPLIGYEKALAIDAQQHLIGVWRES